MQRLFASDLHVGDGLFNDNFSLDEEFSSLLESVASSGKPTELVLLGDIFELLESKMVRDMGLCSFEEVCEGIDVGVVDQIFSRHPRLILSSKKVYADEPYVYVVGNHIITKRRTSAIA